MKAKRIVVEMKDHGGYWGNGYVGEERYRITEFVDAEGNAHPNAVGVVMTDTFLNQHRKAGAEIVIVQLGDYPAAPGLRRCVVKK